MTPWMNSDDLISFIKLNIMMPVSQNTMSEEDLLTFCNKEMMISQVPSVLSFNQEYFVVRESVEILPNVSKYAIPERAIGGRLRDLFYMDESGNLFDMTRIDSENRAYFQNNGSNVINVCQYFLEGNYIVLSPEMGSNPVGSLLFIYFLRPNQLVTTDRAAIINDFSRTITIDNTTLIAGDTITIGDDVFTAVASGAGANEFNIGATSIITASNLSASINTNGIGTSTTDNNIITFLYTDITTEFTTSNSNAFTIQTTQGIVFDSIPSVITDNTIVDFLQTKSGHRTKAMDITIPTSGVSGMTISFIADDVPTDLIVGDYICLANECIIPQIPTDLHNALAERACARILAAIGDQQGLQATKEKLQEIEVRQGTLLDNRVASQPTKILARKSLLRYGKIGPWGWRA